MVMKKYNIIYIITLILNLNIGCTGKQRAEQSNSITVENGTVIENVLTEKLGTIVNTKWSTYKYRSHFKDMGAQDNNIEMYSKLIKDESGSYNNLAIDIYVKNDSIVWQGCSMPFDYEEFIKYDSLLLDCIPNNVIGDFTPEDKFWSRQYFFDEFYVQVGRMNTNYYVHYYSRAFRKY